MDAGSAGAVNVVFFGRIHQKPVTKTNQSDQDQVRSCMDYYHLRDCFRQVPVSSALDSVKCRARRLISNDPMLEVKLNNINHQKIVVEACLSVSFRIHFGEYKKELYYSTFFLAPPYDRKNSSIHLLKMK